MKSKPLFKIINAVGVFVLLLAVLFALFWAIESIIEKNGGEGLFSGGNTDKIYYESEWYVPNSSVESYLILGIDRMVEGGTSIENSKQTDFIALLILNKSEKNYKILQLNRDTMAEIPLRDVYGKIYGTATEQLALAHTYGSSDRERSRNTIAVVEDLLYGIDIDHFMTVTMDAVPILNDSIGGVEVTLLDDFTDIDESYVKGATVTLMGDMALTYVRARSSLEDKTNLHRMERQRQYVSALFEEIDRIEDIDLSKTVSDISDYFDSDCTVDQISRLLDRLESYSFEGIITIDGEAKSGDKYVEFYLDEDAARRTVIELFYKKQN